MLLPRCHNFRPCLESLEARDLPSASPAPVVVHAGGSIQQAVTAARPGSTILIEPGTYNEAVTVDKANIKLIGLPGGGGVVIQNPGGQDNGVSVTANGGGFELTNVTVRGFDQNGVLLDGVNGFRLANVAAVNNHDYGLFPVYSAHGVIEYSSASGSNDTGIYVGQSSDVTIRYSAAHDNVNGIEVENSTNVGVYGNVASDNTVGIFVDLLPTVVPGITVTGLSHVTVQGNVVLGNNRPNTADPLDIAAAEEPGLGVLVLGGDHTTVSGNTVLGNGSGGVVLLSGLDLITLGALPQGAYTGLDPNPEHTLIQNNVVLGNGLSPADQTLPHADLLASLNALAGSGNHWQHNLFRTSIPPQLP